MKAISIIQVGLGMVATINLTLQFTETNWPAVMGWFVVLLQCGSIISMTEGSES